MSALAERVARASRPSLWRAFDAAPDSPWTAETRRRELTVTARSIGATLAALREPSEAALRSAEDETVFQTWDEIRRCLGRLLDAFARENGLDPPPAEERQP